MLSFGRGHFSVRQAYRSAYLLVVGGIFGGISLLGRSARAAWGRLLEVRDGGRLGPRCGVLRWGMANRFLERSSQSLDGEFFRQVVLVGQYPGLAVLEPCACTVGASPKIDPPYSRVPGYALVDFAVVPWVQHFSSKHPSSSAVGSEGRGCGLRSEIADLKNQELFL